MIYGPNTLTELLHGKVVATLLPSVSEADDWIKENIPGTGHTRIVHVAGNGTLILAAIREGNDDILGVFSLTKDDPAAYVAAVNEWYDTNR